MPISCISGLMFSQRTYAKAYMTWCIPSGKFLRIRIFLTGLILLTNLVLPTNLDAQWKAGNFDDSDMALDLTEALTFQKYPTYPQYVEMMQRFASRYPEICRLDTFGTSEEGRLLLALKISDHVQEDEDEARFFYTSTIHGDELVGYVLLLRLADTLLTGYGSVSDITALVDSLAIWINPLANPDGSYSSDQGLSLTDARRTNSKGIDLNRDFPDSGSGEGNDTTMRAAETRHMMYFMQQHRFTMSANIHSGTEVVNYPWDHTRVLHADDPWYRFISREYADETMAVDPGYMWGWPDNGITNGAEWYIITGGRQDYVNYYLEGREVTLELSNEKLLESNLLEEHWRINRRSLLNYMVQCTYGIRGRVSDEISGDPVRAQITLPDHDSSYSVVHSSATHGDFYRLIKEGIYDLVVSANGYLADTTPGVEVTDYRATWLDIRLARDPGTGIHADHDTPAFQLYPNPAREQIYISTSPAGGSGKETGHITIKVYGIDGQLKLQKDLYNSGSPVPLTITPLKSGFYVMKITRGALTRVLPFIKE